MRDADVIVVGLRCAGAPLALALHRAGLKVIAVEGAGSWASYWPKASRETSRHGSPWATALDWVSE